MSETQWSEVIVAMGLAVSFVLLIRWHLTLIAHINESRRWLAKFKREQAERDRRIDEDER